MTDTNTNGAPEKKPTGTALSTKIGVGLAFAASLGAYFLYGSRRAEQNREVVRGWMLKLRGEVLERVEDMKDVTREKYEAVVDEVAERYRRVERVSASELQHLQKELKASWRHVVEQVKP